MKCGAYLSAALLHFTCCWPIKVVLPIVYNYVEEKVSIWITIINKFRSESV